MPIQDNVVRYTLLGILAALLVLIALLFLGPIVSQPSFYPCPDLLVNSSRPAEFGFGVQKVAATSCVEPSRPAEEPRPSPGTLRSPQGALGGSLVSVGGQPWEFDDLCEVGTLLDGDQWVEARMTLEFPVTASPTGAPVSRATLRLYYVSGNGVDQFALSGYPGDGQVDETDAVINGEPIRFAAGMLGYADHDVTTLVTPEAIAGGWAGFSVRADPPVLTGSGSGHSWECVGDANYPILTVEYDAEN